MRVLFATSECAPLAKTGGLGDVSAALPAALRAQGIDARVLLPGYSGVLKASAAATEIARFTVFEREIPVRLLEMRLPNDVPLLVLDCPTLYAREGGPYQRADGRDWEDNSVRFGVLSKVAALLGTGASPLPWRPDVVHCNDWQASLAPVYLAFSPPPRAATVVTIHNLAFQGIFPFGEMAALELPAQSLGFEGIEFYGNASFLKGALVHADAITTVSPTYATEIQGEALGFGLDGVLRKRSADLVGVRNGIDTTLWNPESDPRIASRYGRETLDRKRENKRALKSRMNLGSDDELPLLGLVSRLTHQKGIDVLVEATPGLAPLPAQILVLGTGDAELIGRLNAARAKFPQAIAVALGFDEDLAHLIEAGADIFLMPSRFEPCGMNQMYSQRYGTLPVAHATGGLIDTIADGETGFLFRDVTAASLVRSVKRALTVYRRPERWRKMQKNAMARDFGWESAAREYAAIYARLRSTSSAPSRSGA